MLCVHEYVDFAGIIQEGLENLGFTVLKIDTKESEFHYKNFRQRFYNFLRKTFLRDSTYKEKLRKIAAEEAILSQIEGFGEADYALLIRADILPKRVIGLIREKCKTLCAYHWDGLDRFPIIFPYIPLFDQYFRC